jgi:hypothetical protein
LRLLLDNLSQLLELGIVAQEVEISEISNAGSASSSSSSSSSLRRATTSSTAGTLALLLSCEVEEIDKITLSCAFGRLCSSGSWRTERRYSG